MQNKQKKTFSQNMKLLYIPPGGGLPGWTGRMPWWTCWGSAWRRWATQARSSQLWPPPLPARKYSPQLDNPELWIQIHGIRIRIRDFKWIRIQNFKWIRIQNFQRINVASIAKEFQLTLHSSQMPVSFYINTTSFISIATASSGCTQIKLK